MQFVQSRLSLEEIVNLSFSNTRNYLQAFRSETNGTYLEWSHKTVKSRVDKLLSIFNEDKANFLNLSDFTEDTIAVKLSFKNIEGSLVNFQTSCNGTDWWNSSVRNRIDNCDAVFFADKSFFLKLFKDKT